MLSQPSLGLGLGRARIQTDCKLIFRERMKEEVANAPAEMNRKKEIKQGKEERKYERKHHIMNTANTAFSHQVVR